MTPVVNIQVVDLHSTRVREVVTPNEDGSYTILINAWLDPIQQRLAFEHAMSHITGNHFEGACADQIEVEVRS